MSGQAKAAEDEKAAGSRKGDPPPERPRLGFWARLQAIAARFGAGILVLTAVAFGADRLMPPDLSAVSKTSTLVTDKDGHLLRAFTNRAGTWRLPATPDQVDPLYLRMLIAYEDRRFRHHPGVDPIGVARALGQAVAARRVVSGASTLTMQTARLLEPRPRTIGAKLAQTLRALQLEGRLSKDRILSAYLTLAPFGGNLEGVRAASLAYLGKEPRRLAPHEAALLVVLPQAPSRLRPDRHPEAARAARDKVLKTMVRRGVLTAVQAREAMEAPVPTARRPLPFHAPHLARRLVSKPADGRIVRTSIDRDLQASAERLLRRVTKGLGDRATVAAIIVETSTRRIRAYVGSGDFFDARRAGQIDMVRAMRSPGSTLKPFVYGIGFDDRIIHPETIVADVPTRFGDYQPENFRRVYHGEVTIREALQQSLNIPAVAVLDRVGPVRLAARLRAAGAALAFDPNRGKVGLPLALGGAGISLRDLTMLYAALADGGRSRPLTIEVTGGGAQPDAAPLMSAAAAWYLARILEAAPPPTDFVGATNARRPRKIAYKTGTSYGFRDAWSVGYDGRYTIGVWVGRPDGTPSPGSYGRKTAAPVLFRLFGLLPDAGPALPGKPPAGVVMATQYDLPDRLRRFGVNARRGGRQLVSSGVLSIVFPPKDAVVELQKRRKGEGYSALPLAAEGGRKPLTWVVNGRPLASLAHRRQIRWTPDGEGFVQVTVIDADGQRAAVTVRLKAPAGN